MTDPGGADPATTTRPSRPVGRLGRVVGDDRAWLATALVTTLLLGWSGEEASSLAWLNPLVFVVALAVRLHDTRRRPLRWRLTGWLGAVLMIAIGWAVGMVIELTIAAGGDGFGGMHPDTGPSFILAQGFYVPAAAVTWFAVRRYGLDTRRAFFFAGTLAWWEALTVGAVALLSPLVLLAPLFIAYYVSTYALCGMAGLLVIDAAGLAGPTPRPITSRRLLAYGFLAGTGCWVVFLLWAAATSRIFGFPL